MKGTLINYIFLQIPNIKMFNFQNILPALALGFNISCVFFLARSFLLIKYRSLVELGAGAIVEDFPTLFGIRHRTVRNAIQQKSEAIFGLFLLGLASLLDFIIQIVALKQPVWFFSIIFVILTIIISLAFGRFAVFWLNYYFFVQEAKESIRVLKATWVKLDCDQRNQKLVKQVKFYKLGNYYENKVIKKLQGHIAKVCTHEDGP